MQYWLTVDGSLTTLLETKAKQPLRVKRAFEGYVKLSMVQKQWLGYQGVNLNRPSVGWMREVWLYGNDITPWVAAQSIFPLPSLQGEAKRLKHLKGMPIGYVLFKRQATVPNRRRINKTPRGWQRQTVYDWRNRPLIISETFLPSFWVSL